MRNGKRLSPPDQLIELRRRAAAELSRLPAELQGLEPAKAYPVRISPGLRALTAKLDQANQ
jgi:hypothetical protein